MKKLIITLLGLIPFYLFSQNITDIAVMNDKSADALTVDEKQITTIADTVFLHPERIRYDRHCIQIDGKDTFLFSGAFHYFRVPQPLWGDRFKKLKAAGFNCVETYIPWNWHERMMPKSVDDVSQLDMKPLNDFLTMADAYGLYVIVRPGPYICAEWSGGGFPQWIMQKKPKSVGDEAWLQSNEPGFMSWNEHWYRAVCRVVAPHQIVNKPMGSKGVVLFQIENEFNRIKWFSKSAKKNYLEQLAEIARKYEIEVPVITCWTDEARNVTEGPLNGVVDMVNSYPRWQVEKNFGRLINMQLRTQPGKPLLSGELQGGWCSELGGELSWKQDGLLPVQTQNIALYALQRGFCALNFYMTVGGVNLDDWAARQQTTTYDYAAAIGENGAVNERYRRFCGLSSLLLEHGTKIARAELKVLSYISSDPDVKVVLRQTKEGDRYYFIRTEEHTRAHFGTVQLDNLTLDFALEPFGSVVYYIPAGAKEGEWFPKLPAPRTRPMVHADTIKLHSNDHFMDTYPKHWKTLNTGESIDNHGIYDRHFIYYKTWAPQGKLLEIGRIGHKMVNGTDADTVLVSVDGKLIPICEENGQSAFYRLPGDSSKRKNVEVVMLFENRGLHHHTNKQVEDYWKIGPLWARCDGKELPLQYACTEKKTGVELSQTHSSALVQRMRNESAHKDNPLLSWYQYSFTLPEQPKNIRYPYHLRLEHSGNGFIYLNGHCIGRCWEKGPQRDYYLPECWLTAGGENVITVSLRPTEKGAQIEVAEVIPVVWAAQQD